MISRSLEGAQSKIEGLNFDARKQLLSYDNVLNTQRESVYAKRREILEGKTEDLEKYEDELADKYGVGEVIADKKESLGEEDFYKEFKRLYLQSIDVFWMEHLDNMAHLRSSVGLRAYGQRDPLIEYQKEGRIMFSSLEESVESQVVELIDNLSAGAFKKEEERLKQAVRNAKLISGDITSDNKGATIISGPKYGRNEVVTIVKDGEEQEMKFKKAERFLEEGWQIK